MTILSEERIDELSVELVEDTGAMAPVLVYRMPFRDHSATCDVGVSSHTMDADVHAQYQEQGSNP